MQLGGTTALLIVLQFFCVHSVVDLLNEGASPQSSAPHSEALSPAARKVLDSDDCTVDWIGTDNESTFDSSLELLSEIPNEHDTLAGGSLLSFIERCFRKYKKVTIPFLQHNYNKIIPHFLFTCGSAR